VGYLVLHDFRASAGEEFLNAAVRLNAANVNALVLGLRMNPDACSGPRPSRSRVLVRQHSNNEA
jgi:hypothetical protein